MSRPGREGLPGAVAQEEPLPLLIATTTPLIAMSVRLPAVPPESEMKRITAAAGPVESVYEGDSQTAGIGFADPFHVAGKLPG